MAHVPVLQPHVHARCSLPHSRAGRGEELPRSVVRETRAPTGKPHSSIHRPDRRRYGAICALGCGSRLQGHRPRRPVSRSPEVTGRCMRTSSRARGCSVLGTISEGARYATSPTAGLTWRVKWLYTVAGSPYGGDPLTPRCPVLATRPGFFALQWQTEPDNPEQDIEAMVAIRHFKDCHHRGAVTTFPLRISESEHDKVGTVITITIPE
jgi:hypothetical protein